MVFKRSAGTVWTNEAELSPDVAPYEEAHFGESVAIDGAVVAIPAPGSYVNACYLFTPWATGWRRGAILTLPSEEGGEGFGSSVAVSGRSVLVGAPYDSTPAGDGAGSAHVWTITRFVR